MKLRNTFLAFSALALACGFAVAEPEVRLGSTAEGVEFTKAPKTYSAVHVIQGAVPGTVVLRQELGFKERGDMGMICYYLVRGSVEDAKALVTSLKPESVIQFSCEKG